MNTISRHCAAEILILTLVLVNGCSLLKASPAPEYGFLPRPDLLEERRDRAPFHGYWADEERLEQVKNENFGLAVLTVQIERLEQELNGRRLSDRAKQQALEEAQEVAGYLRERFKLAVNYCRACPFEVTDSPIPRTLLLQLALVELAGTNRAINIAGTAGGVFAPGASLIKFFGRGTVAIEGFLREAQSGRILMQFKDREADKTPAVSLKEFQEYGYVREAIDDWANQFAELLSTTPGQQVRESSPVTLKPF